MRGKNKIVYCPDEIHWTNKAVNIMKQCIKKSNQNVYRPYDLFRITLELADMVRYDRDRQKIGLATTTQIMDCINWMKEKKLI